MRRARARERSAVHVFFSAACALVALLRLLQASLASAASLLPIHDVVPVDYFDWGQVYTVDLGSLPTRPWIVVEVTTSGFPIPPLVTVSITNWNLTSHPGDCPGPTNTIGSQSSGSAQVAFSLNNCDPRPDLFAGQTADVYVVVNNRPFSGQVSVTIRGETHPPTGTLIQPVDPPNVPMQVTLPASKDTVVYADDASASNGAGAWLWAGDRQVGPLRFPTRYPRRSLIAFDLNTSLPPIATVTDARLRLTVTSTISAGEPLQIQRIVPGASGSWGEGTAVAPNDGFFGVASPSSLAADWFYRDRPNTPWAVPGVDVASTVGELAAQPGVVTLENGALVGAVQSMIQNGTGDAGFLLSSPTLSVLPVPVQLASREHPDPASRPQLIVDYFQSAVYESGTVSTNVVHFINEGQNFRWVYDVSVRDAQADGRFVTDNGGICQVAAQVDPPRSVPYTYGFQGSPGFTGVDCCTWRVDSPQTGTVGTGQALFFHNLDASNPANMPPDSDQDGIRDTCDNCSAKANGPLRGTCLIGLLGAPCHSNGECGTGGKCNLSQEDANGDFVGNVCAVPEPGATAALFAGALSLALAGAKAAVGSTGSRRALSRRARDARAPDRRSSSGSRRPAAA